MIQRLLRLRKVLGKALPLGLGLAALFVGQVVLARLVGVEAYGAYGYLLTWITLAGLLTKAGHDYSVMKTLPILKAAGAYGKMKFLLVRTTKVLTFEGLFASASLCVVALVLTSLRGGALSFTVLALGAALVLVLAWGALRRATMLALGRTWGSELPENILKPLLFVAGVWWLLQWGVAPQPNVLLGVNLSVSAVLLFGATFVSLIFVPPPIRQVSAERFDLSDVRGVARSMRLANLVTVILRSADVLLVGALTDAATTGIYIAASRVAAMASVIVAILDPVVGPSISAASVSDDRAGLRSMAIEYALLSTLGSVCFILLMVIAGDRVLGLFGAEFVSGRGIALILLVGHAASSVTGPSGIFLSMTGSHEVSFRISLISAVGCISLLAILVPLYSAVGAAISCSLAVLAKNIAQSVVVWRKYRVNTTLLPLRSRGCQCA